MGVKPCPTCGHPRDARGGTEAELISLLHQRGGDGRLKNVYRTAADAGRWCVTYTRGVHFDQGLIDRLKASGRLRRVYPECEDSFLLC